MANDVLDHHHGAVDDHAEVQRSQRKQVGGNVVQVETGSGKQQRERNGAGNDECAAHIAEEEQTGRSPPG